MTVNTSLSTAPEPGSGSAVTVLLGAGSIGAAIARRVGVGSHVLVADLRLETAEAVVETLLDAGYEASASTVDLAERGGRVSSISPGIVITPLARDELTGPRGAGHRRMVELLPVGRAGTPDEIASLAALLMGSDGGYITGSDILIDGGVTASWYCGPLAPGSA